VKNIFSGFFIYAFFCAILFSLVSVTSCGFGRSWTSFRGDDGSGRSASAIELPVGLRWKILLQKHTGEDRFFNQPIVDGNAIYFGSSDGNFYSMDINTGFMNWSVRTGGPVNSVPCVDKKHVYFGSSDGMVYCVNRESGATVWTYQTGGQVNSTIVRYGDRIVAASDSDGVYFFSPTGEKLLSLSNKYWFHNSFQIYDGKMVFAPGTPERPTNLAIFDIPTQRYLWAIDPGLVNYPWFSFPVVQGGKLFYSATGINEDGRLGFKFFCLDFKTGGALWQTEDQSYFSPDFDMNVGDFFMECAQLLDYGAPLVWRDRVIYSCGDNMLRAFSTRNGSELWKREYPSPISTAVTLAGGRLYFGLRSENDKGFLVCASAFSGKQLWSISVEGSILNSPVIAGSRIFFGTDAGFFYVFEDVL